jgi:hypothetical protein
MADRDLIAVLAALAEADDLTVEDLCAHTGRPANGVGKQLQALGAAGLLVTNLIANTRRYSLHLDPLAELGARLEAETQPAGRLPPDGLRQYFRGDRVQQLPAARKRQIELLHWIVEDFEPNRDYSESEVNAILGRRHPDFATLRRDLIDEGLMERERGIYRRIIDGTSTEV